MHVATARTPAAGQTNDCIGTCRTEGQYQPDEQEQKKILNGRVFFEMRSRDA
jgi:hypothetical protein